MQTSRRDVRDPNSHLMTNEGIRWQAWLTAARPAAFGMIALPLLWGQALAFLISQQFSWAWLLVTVLFGALCQAYCLYLNDYADEYLDRLNQGYWLSGGSRVIPDGELTGQQLYRAAWLLVSLMLVLGLLVSFFGRPWILVLTGCAIGLGWSYSLPPIKSSYRGHGELHQAISCGITLPVIGFYLQTGTLGSLPWISLLPIAMIFFASNIITALPDENPDREGGKRSYPVRHGGAASMKHALALLIFAYILVFAISAFLLNAFVTGFWVTVPATGLLLAAYSQTNRTSNEAPKAFMALTLGSQAWVMLAWTTLLFWAGLQSL